MKPKRKLKDWVKVALLLLPQIVIALLLFFIAINLKKITNNTNIDIHIANPNAITWSVSCE